uniref:AIG1-type G domain-containing protein n=1 Tax=Alexandrium catenella TaxID=2925 RepID=A0A7S1LBE9_ALECA
MGKMQLTVFDTPGLGDTKGRSLDYLDQIMDALKQEMPDAIVLVTDERKFGIEVNVGLLALRQCLYLAFSPGRIILLTNKFPTHFQLKNSDPFIEEFGEAEEHLKTLAQEKLHEVSEIMTHSDGTESLTSVVRNSNEQFDGIPLLRQMLCSLPPNAWPGLQKAKTFTKARADAYQAVHNNSDYEQAQQEAEDLKELVAELKLEVESYKGKRTAGWAVAAAGAGVGVLLAAGAMPAAILFAGAGYVAAGAGAAGTAGAVVGLWEAANAGQVVKRLKEADKRLAAAGNKKEHAVRMQQEAKEYLRRMDFLKARLSDRILASDISQLKDLGAEKTEL